MIDLVVEHGAAGASAVFSADPGRTMRFRLTRKIIEGGSRRVVFIMLNPSTADAFKLDPTITKCAVFARRWGMHDLEVVNLYAYRSPKPRVLRAHALECLIRFPQPDVALEAIGCGRTNDAQILEACVGADRVIAAWGNHGEDDGLKVDGRTRGEIVRSMLVDSNGVELWNLGATESGAPLHPLARGKSWIPYDREPIRWAA